MQLESQRIVNVHSRFACEGEPCTIHNKTDHQFRDCAQVFSPIDRRMYRVCGSMNFHLDPDERNKPVGYVEPDCC